MLVTGSSIYQGSSEISKVFQGTVLVWQKENGPAWPAPYYYPDLTLWNNYGRGIGYWKDHFNSGETATFYFKSDDCESEGGDRYFTYKSKTTGQTLNVDESSYSTSIRVTANTDSNYFWLMPYSHYEARYDIEPNFRLTALCFRQQTGSCGDLIRLASNFDLSNVELLVDLSPQTAWGEGINFRTLVESCPNLSYIALNKDGTNTGQTFTLTGSTAWTLDSMRFTEWYCPGTTFIIENNSWWRSRIDWEIAAERNITFKDPNGNIITQ